MAKRRKAAPVVSDEGLPVELLSAEGDAWLSVDSSLEWFELQGLDFDLAVLERGPASRHRAGVEAWALANGWSKPWCSANPRLVPDGARLREAGVRLNASAALVERLHAAGVKVD